MTHYDEFGLAPTASLDEIQRAHRNLARLLHPDPIQDQEQRRLAESQLKRLNGIYSTLIDPVRRRNYDMQLAQPIGAVELVPGPRPWRPAPWHLPSAIAAAVSLLAGFQAAAWWADAGQPRGERLVYVERPVVGAPLPHLPGSIATPAPASHEDWQQLAADTRELRRVLNQVIVERDQALARLGALRSTPAIPTGPDTSVAAKPASPPAAMPEPYQPQSAAALDPAKPTPLQPHLAGTWIYSPPGGRTSPSDQYPAEYIELVLIERDDLLIGRYRARYKVPDRALSPEVEFFFEGPGAGDRRYAWRGNAGSKGEIHLELLSDHTLSLDWFTSQLGRNPMLGSGTAVLVRRRSD